MKLKVMKGCARVRVRLTLTGTHYLKEKEKGFWHRGHR